MLRTLLFALLAAVSPCGALAAAQLAATTPATPAEAPAAASALDPRAGPAAGDRESPTGPLAEGRVESQGARVEILGKPVRAGEEIRLPEGFLRVEEEGVEDREVGSFSIVPARTLRPATLARAAPGPNPREAPSSFATGEPPPPPAPMERPCRQERAAYLRELWKQSGIEVADPDAVVEGLESAGGGLATDLYWFALAPDPFRPLAWSSSLRSLADGLARCVRGG